MILYLHGFRSSPRSFKAQKLAQVVAARRARGQVAVHNSMLIHVTRFQAVQDRVTDQIRTALLFVKDRIRHGVAVFRAGVVYPDAPLPDGAREHVVR